MPSIFSALFAHTDNCKDCDPSGYPLCETGRVLLKSATEVAALIVAPIPEIPKSPHKA
jgi:hypothetical protein